MAPTKLNAPPDVRLTELNPHWVTMPNYAFTQAERPFHIGVRFDCPHCGRPLAAMFDPPIDPTNVRAVMAVPWMPMPDRPCWKRTTGETFDTLTLSPSIDVSKYGHWHGFITNGEVA